MASFSSLFDPPELQTSDYVYEAKYLLAYRMSLFLVVTIGLLDIALFVYFNIATAFVALVTLLFVIWAIYQIRKTVKYLFPILIFNLVGASACLFTLFGIRDQPHMVDMIWMVINILFTFIVVGQRWGIIIKVKRILITIQIISTM